MDIGYIRREYITGRLSRGELTPDPFDLLRLWLSEAVESGREDPNAMTLSTIGADGYPEARIVLLKSIEEGVLTFFTNYKSRKARDMEMNPKVSLTFYWPHFQRQVRIRGQVSKVPGVISDEYFFSRPRESRISTWASNQSEEITSRSELEENYLRYEKEFKGGEIPRPEYWGGYSVVPLSVEFWQGREKRLHDRFLYEKDGEGWSVKRLAP